VPASTLCGWHLVSGVGIPAPDTDPVRRCRGPLGLWPSDHVGVAASLGLSGHRAILAPAGPARAGPPGRPARGRAPAGPAGQAVSEVIEYSRSPDRMSRVSLPDAATMVSRWVPGADTYWPTNDMLPLLPRA
jgi:hypothetical protein